MIQILTLSSSPQWACLLLFVACTAVVFVWLLAAFIAFWRKDQGVRVPGHASMAIELLWMIIPFVILVALAWPVLRLLLSAG